jgi:hypothetical protein
MKGFLEMTEPLNEDILISKNQQEQHQRMLKQEITNILNQYLLSYDDKIRKLDNAIINIINENKIILAFIRYILEQENISKDDVFNTFIKQYNDSEKEIFKDIYKKLF